MKKERKNESQLQQQLSTMAKLQESVRSQKKEENLENSHIRKISHSCLCICSNDWNNAENPCVKEAQSFLCCSIKAPLVQYLNNRESYVI